MQAYLKLWRIVVNNKKERTSKTKNCHEVIILNKLVGNHMAKPHRNVLWVNRNHSWSTFFVLGPIFDIWAGYILSGVLD